MEYFWDVVIGTFYIVAGLTIIVLAAAAIQDVLQRYYDRGE